MGTLLERVASLAMPAGVGKELIIVDDGSTDASADVIQDFQRRKEGTNVVFIRHPKNLGKGAAVRTAMKAAQGDILIIQDADLEYEPTDILEVASPILRGEQKIVYGSRILREKELGRSGFLGLITGKHPHSYVLAYLGGVTVTMWINFLTGSKLTDEPTCYKCFHRSALEGVSIDNDDFAWEPELTMKLLTRGFEIAEVPISYNPRRNSDGKKINWRDGLKALLTSWKYRQRASAK